MSSITITTFRNLPLNEMQAAFDAARFDKDITRADIRQMGDILDAHEYEEAKTALLAVNWSQLVGAEGMDGKVKRSPILPNGGRMGPRSDASLVIAVAAFAQNLLRSYKATLDGKNLNGFIATVVEAAQVTLSGNAVSERKGSYIKRVEVTEEDGLINFRATPQYNEETRAKFKPFSVTTRNSGPLSVAIMTTVNQSTVSGSAA